MSLDEKNNTLLTKDGLERETLVSIEQLKHMVDFLLRIVIDEHYKSTKRTTNLFENMLSERANQVLENLIRNGKYKEFTSIISEELSWVSYTDDETDKLYFSFPSIENRKEEKEDEKITISKKELENMLRKYKLED
jgi:hypothetical protein